MEPPRLAGRTPGVAAKAEEADGRGRLGAGRSARRAPPRTRSRPRTCCVRSLSPCACSTRRPGLPCRRGGRCDRGWTGFVRADGARAWPLPAPAAAGGGDGPALPRVGGGRGRDVVVDGFGPIADVVAVRVPQDRVYLERTLETVFAADAVRANAVVPAWREVPLDVQVVDEAGRPIPDSEVVEVLVAGSRVPVRVEAWGPAFTAFGAFPTWQASPSSAPCGRRRRARRRRPPVPRTPVPRTRGRPADAHRAHDGPRGPDRAVGDHRRALSRGADRRVVLRAQRDRQRPADRGVPRTGP